LPWVEIDRDEKIIAADRNPDPYIAKVLALLDENNATNSMSSIGLMSHQGNEPTPPGFPWITKCAPPPGSDIPGSLKNLDGEINASKEYGAVSKNGARSSVKRLYSRAKNKGRSLSRAKA
jgi:hypothetical protein